MINNIGTITKQKLLKKFKTPENIYNLKDKNELIKCGIREETIDNIMNKKTKEYLMEYMKIMEKRKIKIVTIEDRQYPQILKNIYVRFCRYFISDKVLTFFIFVSIMSTTFS